MCSVGGDFILWGLGERAVEWFRLRCASEAIRVAVVCTVADVLRLGPRALAYEGHQWFEAVEDWIVQGDLDEIEPEPEPGVVDGGEPLPPELVDGPPLEEADVWDDPAIDEFPHRPALEQPLQAFVPIFNQLLVEEDSSSSEGVSTTEPSGSIQGERSAASELEEDQPQVGRMPVPSGRPVAGTRYLVGPERLLVVYGDDELAVPLTGWTAEQIEAVVEGLNTGIWQGFSEALGQE